MLGIEIILLAAFFVATFYLVDAIFEAVDVALHGPRLAPFTPAVASLLNLAQVHEYRGRGVYRDENGVPFMYADMHL